MLRAMVKTAGATPYVSGVQGRMERDVRAAKWSHLGVEDPRLLAVHLHDQLLVHRYLSAKQQARCHYPEALRGDTEFDETDAREPFAGPQCTASQYHGGTIMSSRCQ